MGKRNRGGKSIHSKFDLSGIVGGAGFSSARKNWPLFVSADRGGAGGGRPCLGKAEGGKKAKKNAKGSPDVEMSHVSSRMHGQMF